MRALLGISLLLSACATAATPTLSALDAWGYDPQRTAYLEQILPPSPAKDTIDSYPNTCDEPDASLRLIFYRHIHYTAPDLDFQQTISSHCNGRLSFQYTLMLKDEALSGRCWTGRDFEKLGYMAVGDGWVKSYPQMEARVQMQQGCARSMHWNSQPLGPF